jgi:hypothetical protein
MHDAFETGIEEKRIKGPGWSWLTCGPVVSDLNRDEPINPTTFIPPSNLVIPVT